MLKKTTNKILPNVVIIPIANEADSLNTALVTTIRVGKTTDTKNPDPAIIMSPLSLSKDRLICRKHPTTNKA